MPTDYRANARARYKSKMGPRYLPGGRGRTHQAKYMKKTTKKGAYNKTAKANFQRRRAPLVETKVRILKDISDGSVVNPIISGYTYSAIQNDDAFTHISMVPFLSQTQGLGENQMIGNSIYSRYLKCKLSFLYPSGVKQLATPCNQYIVHGWIKNGMGLTNFTAPTQGACVRSDVSQHIINRVKEYFNARTDRLEFIPKTDTGIKILGYRKIKNDKNSQFSTEGNNVGPINMSCTWTINRKIHYTQGMPLSTTPGVGPNDSHMYPNAQQYLPFLVIFNPQFASMPQQSPPGTPTPVTDTLAVSFNIAHWYSDS